VSLPRLVDPSFEVIHAGLVLALAKETLDVPAKEGHAEHLTQLDILLGVAQEVLGPLGLHDVASDDQPLLVSGDLLLPRVEAHHPSLPHGRPFLQVLDVPGRPGRTAPFPESIHAPRFAVRASRGQPTREVAGDLYGIGDPQILDSQPEGVRAPVRLVRAEPHHGHTSLGGGLQLLEAPVAIPGSRGWIRVQEPRRRV